MTARKVFLWGCLPLLFASLLTLALATGLVETRQPVAHFAAPRAFALRIESAADSRVVRSTWPIVWRSDYADDAILRGMVELPDARADVSRHRVLVEAPGGIRRWDSCSVGDKTTIVGGEPVVSRDPKSCYFYVDLRPADLRKGVTLSVYDPQRRTRIGAPVPVIFLREARYSFFFWEAMMSV